MESLRQNSKVRVTFDPMTSEGDVKEDFGAHVSASNQEINKMNEQAMFVIATMSCALIGQYDVKQGKPAAIVLRELKREVNKKWRPSK